MTIQEALHHGNRTLQSISDAPDLDAERLLLHILKKHQSSWLYAHTEHILSPGQAQIYTELLHARATGMPLAHIAGESEFYGRPFFVTRDVLIPRPDTERIIDFSLPIIEQLAKDAARPITVTDAGTGSGCIGITLLRESPFIGCVIAIDISQQALEVARSNAKRHGVFENIDFVHGDMRQVLPSQATDIIISNPPYVPSSELVHPTGPERIGLSFEPRIALDGGSQGTDYIEFLKHMTVPVIAEGLGGSVVRLV